MGLPQQPAATGVAYILGVLLLHLHRRQQIVGGVDGQYRYLQVAAERGGAPQLA